MRINDIQTQVRKLAHLIASEVKASADEELERRNWTE
jgi:hypothetical protein